MLLHYFVPVVTGIIMSLYTIVYFSTARKLRKRRKARAALAYSHFPVLVGVIAGTIYLQEIIFQGDTTYNERLGAMVIFAFLYGTTCSICLIRYLKQRKKGASQLRLLTANFTDAPVKSSFQTQVGNLLTGSCLYSEGERDTPY